MLAPEPNLPEAQRAELDRLLGRACELLREYGQLRNLVGGYRFEGLDAQDRWVHQRLQFDGMLRDNAAGEKLRAAALQAAGVAHPGWTLTERAARLKAVEGEMLDWTDEDWRTKGAALGLASAVKPMDQTYRDGMLAVLEPAMALLRRHAVLTCSAGPYEGLTPETLWVRHRALVSAYVADGPTADRKREAAVAARTAP